MTTRIRRLGDEESAATVLEDYDYVEFDLGEHGRIRCMVETWRGRKVLRLTGVGYSHMLGGKVADGSAFSGTPATDG